MQWVLYGCLLLLLLLILILFTKIKVYINYLHAKDDDDLKIEFRALFGIIRYKLKVPLIKIDDNSPSLTMKKQGQAGDGPTKNKGETKITPEELVTGFEDFKSLLEHVFSFYNLLRNFLKKVKVTKLEWYTAVGTGDAAFTGMLTGAIWTIKGSIIGLISHYLLLKSVPVMSVQPYFQMKAAQTTFKCMLQFRIGHAIVAGIKIIKFWKGGLPKFKSKPLSALSNDKTNPI